MVGVEEDEEEREAQGEQGGETMDHNVTPDQFCKVLFSVKHMKYEKI